MATLALQTVCAQQNISRQCAALREIVYQSHHKSFDAIIDRPLRTSHGFQPNGIWKFSTERFSTTMNWVGATSTVIEHATDERDTTFTENWQYIAAFEPMTEQVKAADFIKALLLQVDGCPLPLNDTVLLALKQVDPRYLPPTRPDEWAEAFLFDVPAAADGPAQTSIMFGLERAVGGLRPVLIIERQTERRK